MSAFNYRALSLRKKLQLAFVGLSIILVLLSSGLSLLLAYVFEDAIFDRILKQEVKSAKQVGAKPGLSFIKRFDHRTQLPIEILKQLEETPAQREFAVKQGHFHLRVEDKSQQQKVYWLARVDDLLSVRQGRWFMALCYGFIFIAVMMVALVLAKKLSFIILRPLEALATECDNLEGGAVSQFDNKGEGPLYQENKTQAFLPLVEGRKPSNDEVARISQKLRNTLNLLQQSLRRERDFSRDIGHELRTPMSVYKNTIDLTLKDHPSYASLNRTYRQVVLCVDSLMALARHEVANEQKLNLTEYIEQAILDQADDDCPSIELDVPDRWMVLSEPGLLLILLKNLLANAREHGDFSADSLTIKGHQGVLLIENPIKGEVFWAVKQHNLEQPGYKNKSSTGIGQGLYLVRRICELMSWQLNNRLLESHQGRESNYSIQFVVELNSAP